MGRDAEVPWAPKGCSVWSWPLCCSIAWLFSLGRLEWMKGLRWQQGWVIPNTCQDRQGAELSFLLFSGTSHSCLVLFFHPLLPRGLFEGGSLSCAYLELVLAGGTMPITYILKQAERICFPCFLFFFFFIAVCPVVLVERKIKTTITVSSNILGLLVFGSNLEME